MKEIEEEKVAKKEEKAERKRKREETKEKKQKERIERTCRYLGCDHVWQSSKIWMSCEYCEFWICPECFRKDKLFLKKHEDNCEGSDGGA